MFGKMEQMKRTEKSSFEFRCFLLANVSRQDLCFERKSPKLLRSTLKRFLLFHKQIKTNKCGREQRRRPQTQNMKYLYSAGIQEQGRKRMFSQYLPEVMTCPTSSYLHFFKLVWNNAYCTTVPQYLIKKTKQKSFVTTFILFINYLPATWWPLVKVGAYVF